MKLFDAGKIISSSLGMAVAMSLSSLFLWKSDWLSVPSGSFHGSHGMGIVIGIVTSAAVMLWCSLSRRSLRRFGMQVVPPIALASLVLSGLPVVQGSAQWVLGIAIPVIGSYTLMFSWFYVVSLRDIEGSLMTLLFAWEVAGRLIVIPLLFPDWGRSLPPSALDQIMALLLGMLGLGC